MSELAGAIKEGFAIVARPRYSFVACVTCLVILLVPMPDWLSLDDLRKAYAKFIGGICLLTAIMWATEMTLFCSDKVKDWMEKKDEKAKIAEYLDTLNDFEAKLLDRALTEGTQTITCRDDGDEVYSLIGKQLLEKVEYTKSSYLNPPFTIPSKVWKEIKKPKNVDKIKARLPKTA